MFIKYNPKLTSVATDLRNNSTVAEIEMWKLLKVNFSEYKFLRQKPLENFITDFYCAKLKLIIEVDGEIHNLQKEKDTERDNLFFTKYKITTLRITNEELYNDRENVLNKVRACLPL